MRIRTAIFPAFCLAWVAIAAAAPRDPDDATPPKTQRYSEGRFVFRLLPKSLQKNPDLETTVFTVVTDAGRARPRSSPETPVYFVGQAGEPQNRGDAADIDRAPTAEALTAQVTEALAVQGILPATVTTPRPTLGLVFYCGSHYAMSTEDKELFPDLAIRHNLERATLIGGPDLREELVKRYSGAGRHNYLRDKIDFVIDQATNDLYFVVVSAYDLAAMERKEKVLLWRTTMTVSSRGVAMHESLPTLIATAGPYLGREMTEVEALITSLKRGEVQVGTATVIEPETPAAPAAPAPPAPAQKP